MPRLPKYVTKTEMKLYFSESIQKELKKMKREKKKEDKKDEKKMPMKKKGKC